MEGLAGTLPDPARVVEIGTGSGCSLRSVLIGLERHDDVHAWTIDIKPHPHLPNEMKRFDLPASRFDQILGDSHEVAKDWKIKLDMVYIDGDHTYAGCQGDIFAWTPHLKFGGLMVFDDYEQPMHNVTKAVDDIMFAEDSDWRFVGQVGRLIAFEKGTLTKQAPWLTEYMVKYDSYARDKRTNERDPWLWWAWGFPGNKQATAQPAPRSYGKSPKKHYEDNLP
jgi:hypothetical protein